MTVLPLSKSSVLGTKDVIFIDQGNKLPLYNFFQYSSVQTDESRVIGLYDEWKFTGLFVLKVGIILENFHIRGK